MFILITQPSAFRHLMVAVPLAVTALLFLRDIRLWLLGLPFLIAFSGSPMSLGEFYIEPVTIGILLCGFVYLVYRISSFRRIFDMPLPFKLVFLAYLAQLASVFASIYLHDGYLWNTVREGHKIYIFAIILPVIYTWYGKGIWLERFVKSMTLMLLVMSIIGIYQYNSGEIDNFGDRASGFDLAGRVYSTIKGGPNSYSGVLELLVPTILAAMFFFKSRIWKTTAFAAVILGMFNVLYTFSRGGFLTVTGSCFLYLVYRYRKQIWIPVITFTLFAGYVFSNADEFERQLTVLRDNNAMMTDVSLLHRYTSYKGFVNEMSKNLLEGTGWGGREYFYGRTALYGFWEVRHEDSIDRQERFGGLNSLLLEMPLKGGFFSILSLLLFVSAVVIAMIAGFKSSINNSLGAGMALGLLGFGFHQLFDNLIPWPQTGALFWVVLSLVTAQGYACCCSEEDSL